MYGNEKVSFDAGYTLTSKSVACIRFPWSEGLAFGNGQNRLGLGCWVSYSENRRCARDVYLTTVYISVWAKNATLDPHLLQIWSQKF